MEAQQIAIQLYQIGAIQFGTFTLKSGLVSPIYLDLRRIVSFPELLSKIADAMWQEVTDCRFDVLCGVPYTALPIATAFSLQYGTPMVMRRKEAKHYGTKKMIEGVFTAGQKCLVLEDLITSGASIFETIEPLEQAGLAVSDVVVLIDREQGGKGRLAAAGYCLHSVFSLSFLLTTLCEEGLIEKSVAETIQDFAAKNTFQ